MSDPPIRPEAPEPMHFGLNTAIVEQLARDASVKKVADWISLADFRVLHGATDDARRFIQGKPIRVVMLNDLVQMSRELADDIGGDKDA